MTYRHWLDRMFARLPLPVFACAIATIYVIAVSAFCALCYGAGLLWQWAAVALNN